MKLIFTSLFSGSWIEKIIKIEAILTWSNWRSATSDRAAETGSNSHAFDHTSNFHSQRLSLPSQNQPLSLYYIYFHISIQLSKHFSLSLNSSPALSLARSIQIEKWLLQVAAWTLLQFITTPISPINIWILSRIFLGQPIMKKKKSKTNLCSIGIIISPQTLKSLNTNHFHLSLLLPISHSLPLSLLLLFLIPPHSLPYLM